MNEKILDSNVFIHAFLEPKKNITPRESEIKQSALNIIKAVQKDHLKVLVTTAQIFEISNLLESWLNHNASKDIVEFIVTSSNIKIYPVSQNDLKDALKIMEEYKTNKIGFNDCVTFVAMKNSSIKEIYSFDKHFDQFSDISRLEKTDV